MRTEKETAIEDLFDVLTDAFAAFIRAQRLWAAHRAVEEILGEEMRREDKEAKKWGNQKPVPE